MHDTRNRESRATKRSAAVTGSYAMQTYVGELGVALPKVAALVQHDRSLCAYLYRSMVLATACGFD
jgi:hypothetical protein